jgi:metal-responsive CopG/Arc/MetJ family transcriptional regulator
VAQITLRLPDSLLDRVEAATDSETSRSEWLRDAAREKLDREDREDLEQRVDRLEEQIQRLQRPLWKRVLDRL